MKNIGLAAAGLLASTAIATAGGLDRDQMGTSILFEEGNYVELSFASIDPDVSGTAAGGRNSGDIGPRYTTFSLGYHNDLTDNLSLSFMINQPYGADIAFNNATWPFDGTQADLNSTQYTLAARYEVSNGFSVYGGLRAAEMDVTATVLTSTGLNYSIQAESSTATGYLVGAAYERPDIALRVALTYFSDMTFEMSGTESLANGTNNGQGGPEASSFNVDLPAFTLLEAQSGIAENTLLFGSIRWTYYQGHELRPNWYPDASGTPGGAMATFDNDVITYTLGVGRQINENWAVSASLGYEAAQGGFAGNLTPTDGRRSIGLGAEYTQGNLSIGGGLQYIMIGDAQTVLAGTEQNPLLVSNYSDNTGIAAGIRIGVQF